MRACRVVGIGAVLAAVIAPGCGRDEPPPRGPASRADIQLPSDTEEIKTKVPRDGTLATIFHAYLPSDQAERAAQLIAGRIDPRKLRVDQPFTLTRTLDGWLRGFDYEVDEDHYLRVGPASPSAPRELEARVIEYRRQEVTAVAAGSIDEAAPSLFEAMGRAGEAIDLSVEMAAIFSGEIDFNSELQPGDAFRLAFQKVTRENGTVSYGIIHAAEFTNAGRHLKAYRFVLPDSQFGYYDENGRSLKRFFLKSPLKFEPRITSGFSYSRLHPVLNIRRAHLGVDYAAPIGAPVVAVSHGVVTQAGMAGEAGRMVTLRHASGYESMYLHLSVIAVHVGERVSQGEMIGRVGASGLATGPHLDYRLRKNGVYLNPVLEHRRMPPGEPIPPTLMAAFMTARDKAAALLTPKAAVPAPAAPVPAAGR